MKFKAVRTYQSVTFQNAEENFFTSAGVSSKKFPNIEMEDMAWGIRIKTDKDEVFVSYNNVAWAKQVEPEAAKAPKADKQKAV